MAASPLTKICLCLPCLLALSGCAGFQRQRITGYDHVTVCYATTREFNAGASPDRAFGNV